MSGVATTTRGVGRPSGRPVGGPVRASAGRLSAGTVALLGLLGVAFIALFYRWLVKQGTLSLHHLEDWGHALAIPVISGWMVWTQRKALARTPVMVFWPGLAPLALGLVCYVFFLVGRPSHMLQGFSVLVTVFGAVLLLLGPGVMRYAFLPIAYLVFAVTLAEQLMIDITFQLKLIASYGAWVLLSATGPLIGYSVAQDGNILNMVRGDGSVFEMNVADACSGMRMVVAFVALGGAVALLGTTRWWQRTAIMLLTVPTAVLMNVLQVAVLGWAGYYNENLAGGEAHAVIGVILLFPSLLFFMFLVWALDRLVVEEGTGKASAKGTSKGGKGAVKKPVKRAARAMGPPPPGSGVEGLRRALLSPACAVALVLMAGTAAGTGAAISYFKLYLSKLPIEAPGGRKVGAIPNETESWMRIGDDRLESPEVVHTLGTENYLTRDYVRRSTVGTERPMVVTLHAAYYTGTIDTVPHVPERCFVGGGLEIGQGAVVLPVAMDESDWILDPVVEGDAGLAHLHGRVYTTKLSNEYGDSGGARVRLPLDADEIQMRITGFVQPGVGPVYAGYFFIANGATTASAEGVRTLAFRLEDDYAYYLKVQFTSATARSPEELAAAAASLMDDLLGEIMRCAPDWVEVEKGAYPPRGGPGAGPGGTAGAPGVVGGAGGA